MIYGKNIRLRAIEREDISTFVRWFNDPEVRRYLISSEPMSKAAEEKWFESYLDRQDETIFAIEARTGETWTHIGNSGLHHVDWKNRCALFGIMLGERDYWDKGLGTEVTRLMLTHAFHELNLNRIELEVLEFNTRARRCYEKVGFKQEGVRRQAMFREGRYHDIFLMSILKVEFAPSQRGGFAQGY